MDAKLRVKLNEAVESALDWWKKGAKKRGLRPRKLGARTTNLGVGTPESESNALWTQN